MWKELKMDLHKANITRWDILHFFYVIGITSIAFFLLFICIMEGVWNV